MSLGSRIVFARRLGRKGLLVLALGSFALRAEGQSGSLPFGLIVSEQAQTSFTLVGAGARAAGMGGAFTALADDATAASFNPAGLAQLLVPEASAVVDFTRHRDEYRSFLSYDQVPVLGLSDTTVEFDHTAFNFASVTVPFELFSKRFALELSTQRLVDFTYEGTRQFEEVDAAGNPLFLLEQSSFQSGSIRLYSGSVAFQPTERTLLGVTVNRWDGDWEMASTNSEQSVVAGSERETFTYSQSNRLTGWNVDLGLLLTYPAFNVGVRYRTPFDADYEFDAALETNIQTPLNPLPPTATKLHWPGTLNVGVAIKPTDTLVLAADWGRTDWSKMVFDVPGVGHVNFFDLKPPEETNAGTSDDWHAGAEYLFFVGKTVVPVRAGWFREPQPATDAVTGDRVVRTGLSFGTGVKAGWWAIDASLRYSTASAQVSRFLEADEIASGNLRATSRGDLTRTDWAAFVSLIVQIPSGSAPSRALHEIFVGPSKPKS
ncbi:MAG: hypothetical protein IPP07_12620 [Holophagales bacterium]|nr:hypothetical protein [Holophagales bacterium]MBK9965695.1 hypothetical protein [Holophagales bacterium]